MKRSRIVRLLCGLTVSGLIHTGCGQMSRAETPVAKTAASSSAQLERVVAGHPIRKTLTRETVQPGWIEAFEQAPLVSKVSGYVSAVPVDIGDRVTQGQTLIEISAPELQDEVRQKQAHVAQAEAELRQAEAAVVAAQAAIRTAQARLTSVQAGIVRAEGEYARWDGEYNRLKELATRGSVTEKLVEETLNQLRSSEAAKAEVQAAIQSAQASVEESRAKAGQADADRGAAIARRDVALADLAYVKTMQAYTHIKAPFDGVVTLRKVDPGHFVQPAGSGTPGPLMSVARTGIVRVFLDVPETEAELVDSGTHHADPATITIQALQNRVFQGAVTRTGWSLDPKNRSLRTEIDLNNEENLLRPGMFATVRVRLEQKTDVLTLPATAIMRTDSRTACACVVDGKIQLKPVTLGLRVGDDCEITSGVDERDMVVQLRPNSLTPGQAVEVIPVEKK